MVDESKHEELVRVRREKLDSWRESGGAFPNDFRPDALAAALHADYDGAEAEALADKAVRVAVAGRMLTRRVMGKASFCHLTDRSGHIQALVRRDAIGTDAYTEFKRFDAGDVVGVTGTLIITRTGELTVEADSVRLLV